MARQEEYIGKVGQNLARSVMSGMGINMVEKIGTPVIVIPFVKNGRAIPGASRVIWGEKVSGDHTGILDNGIFVKAETKTIMNRNLRWSDFREHQPIRLLQHSQHHGLSLLVWVHSSGVYVMQFPIEGFGPGKSISVERATLEHQRTVGVLKSVSIERIGY